jgi:hypothetical protein
MAYVTDELLEKALQAIKKHNLFFIEDVVAYLPCSKPTFYEHKLNESNELKELLEINKVNTKVKMRKKWLESENATLQMGLMKLIARGEERKKLSQTYTDVTTKGESLNYTKEERDKRLKDLLDERNGLE